MNEDYKIKDKGKKVESSINFKVTSDLREMIAKSARETSMTISGYMRNLLEQIYDGSYGHSTTNFNDNKNILLDKDSIKLFLWIFSKRNSREVIESNQELDMHIKTIKALDAILPEGVLKELDKVLVELLGIRREPMQHRSFSYNFISSYKSHISLDFEVLDAFFFKGGLENLLNNSDQ